MILFQKSFLTIEYDESSGCLSQNWKGFARSEQFREGIQKSIELCKEKRPAKLISNTKDLAVVKMEDSEWAAAYATPIMMEYGLKFMAFIVPTDSFTQVSVNTFKKKTTDKSQIHLFDDPENARRWFASVDKIN